MRKDAEKEPEEVSKIDYLGRCPGEAGGLHSSRGFRAAGNSGGVELLRHQAWVEPGQAEVRK